MRIILGTALLLTLSSCSPSATEPPRIEVEQARVNLPAVAGRPGAAYFTLRAIHGTAELVSISSPQAGRIELHETVTEDGISRMGRLQKVVVSDAPVPFEPGGKHAMLFGIDPNAKAGDRIQLTFDFERAPDVTVEAEVHAFGGGHAGH